MENESSFVKAQTTVGRSVKCIEFDFKIDDKQKTNDDIIKEFIELIPTKESQELITLSRLAQIYGIDKSSVGKSAKKIGLVPKKVYREETGFQAENAYDKDDVKILSEYMRKHGHYRRTHD